MLDDDMLSQEEINALLNITNDDEANGSSENENILERYLTPLEIDALGEIGNISLGSSATTLSTILNHKVEITTPSVSIVRKTGLKEEFPYEHVKLQVNYLEGFNGENIFLMKASDAAIISDIMLGGDGQNPKEVLSEIELSAVQEAMNQMMGSSATSMSTVFNKKVDISPPTVNYEDIDKLEEVTEEIDEEDIYVRISFKLRVGDLIDSTIMQLIPLKFAKEMAKTLLGSAEEAAAPTAEQQVDTAPSMMEEPKEQMGDKMNQVESKVQAKQQIQMNPTGPQFIGSTVDDQSTVQVASFSEFEEPDLSPQGKQNLDLLLDIPLQVTVELGRTKQKVEEILELVPGSIVELDKLAGEPVDVLVNNKLIAKGEVVVIDENFGVRITDIISTKERLMNLK